jgi:hypothetical protein
MRIVSTLLVSLLATPATSVSQPPVPAATAKPSPAPAPARERQPPTPLANVRVDIKLTDRRGGGEPITKLVSMTIADRRNGMIRATADARLPGTKAELPINAFNTRAVPLNIDVAPMIEGDKVRLHVSLDYNSDNPADAAGYPPLSLRQSIDVVADNGRPMVVADAADPVTDRRVQVEITATIVR